MMHEVYVRGSSGRVYTRAQDRQLLRTAIAIYFGQAARSLSAIDLYSSGASFLLGAGVPGALPPNEGMT
jgi:hypothetical protein